MQSEPTYCILLINSPILEALAPEQCALIRRIMSELSKPVWYLADFAAMPESEMESDLTLS